MITLEGAYEPAKFQWSGIAEMISPSKMGHRSIQVRLGHKEWLASIRSASHWGGNMPDLGVTLIDLQGMDTMIGAHRMVFDDHLAGAAIKGFNLGHDDVRFRRQGAAGAPPEPDFPGGEVLVDELLDINHEKPINGESWTIAGHMQDEHDSGSGVLLLRNGKLVRNRRSIYSHTAIWPCDLRQEVERVPCFPDGKVDALNHVKSIARHRGVLAFAASIRIRPSGSEPCRIITRTLRRLPTAPIVTVEEATQLGAEREIHLGNGEQLLAFGTYYPRVEEGWEAMRSGRPYEPLGHYHCAKFDSRGHVVHVAHLRQALVGPDVSLEFTLRPAARVIRVDPVQRLSDGRVVRGSDGGELNRFHGND